jgi:YggT family protein
VPNLIDPRGPIAEFLYTITEPILAPIRSVMPRMGMFDFTPMIAIILLQVIREVLIRVIVG